MPIDYTDYANAYTYGRRAPALRRIAKATRIRLLRVKLACPSRCTLIECGCSACRACAAVGCGGSICHRPQCLPPRVGCTCSACGCCSTRSSRMKLVMRHSHWNFLTTDRTSVGIAATGTACGTTAERAGSCSSLGLLGYPASLGLLGCRRTDSPTCLITE